MGLRPRTALFLLLALSFVLNLVPVWWGLPAYPTWAPDELMPGSVLDQSRWPAKYPPFHRYVLSGVYRPLDLLMEDDPAAGAWIERLGRLQLAGRLLSVLMGTALVYLVYRFGRYFVGRYTAVLGAAIVALSPPFVYYSKAVNLEIPYLFWFAVSMILLITCTRKGRLRDYVLFGVAAALAVGTKDQAYGLFLTSPLLLIWGRLRRERPMGTWGWWWRGIVDRRLWSAVVAGAVTLAVIHRLPFDSDGFMYHFQTVTGQKTMAYKVYGNSLTNQWTMMVRAVSNFGFALGLPWLVALIAGIAFALRDEKRRLLVLGILALGAAYYVGFVSVIGFHYVRFFMPLVILTAPIAALGSRRMFEVVPSQRVGTAVLAVLLLVSLGRAVAVDAAMITDSRYHVEEFIASRKIEPAMGLGRRGMLPRGLATALWGNLAMSGCGFFDQSTEALVVNVTDLRGDRERALFAKLGAGDFGFDEVLRLPAKPGVRGLSLSRVDSNLAFVNPDIRVFRRSGRPCVDDDSVPEILTGLTDRRDPATEEILQDAIRGGRLTTRAVNASPVVLATNLRPDGWSYGKQPVAVLLENPESFDTVPRFEVGCWAQTEDFPVTVWIDDGRARQKVVFTRAGNRRVSLERLAPGDSLLALAWSDTAWQGRERVPRELGFNLRSVEVDAARD